MNWFADPRFKLHKGRVVFDTGRMFIGERYEREPAKVEIGREAERLQAALLDKRSRFERALDWLDAHPWVSLAVTAAACTGYFWLTGPA
jgi:hypothetical protein